MAAELIQKFWPAIPLFMALFLIPNGCSGRMLFCSTHLECRISQPATKLFKIISAICAAPSALVSFNTPNPGLTAGPSHFRPFGPHLQMYKLQWPG